MKNRVPKQSHVIGMKRVFEAPVYYGVKGQLYVKAEELTKADIAKIQACIKGFK